MCSELRNKITLLRGIHLWNKKKSTFASSSEQINLFITDLLHRFALSSVNKIKIYFYKFNSLYINIFYSEQRMFQSQESIAQSILIETNRWN